jgi:putative photosynthetic complex assembly protein
MGSPSHVHPPFPPGILRATAAMIVGVVLVVAFVRLTGIGAATMPPAAVVEQRELRFADRDDGGIDVYDARDGRLVRHIEPGTHGFLRGTMRGLARERKRQDVGADVPFRLIAHADGRMTLEDPGTGRRVDLGSFGPTNAAAFAQLMTRDRP